MALPFVDLEPLHPDDAFEEGMVVDASILVPNDSFHIDNLFISRSEVALEDGRRLTEAGLFTSVPIRSGKLIGLFTGEMIPNDTYENLSPDLKRRLGKYAVSMDESVDVTVSPISPLSSHERFNCTENPLALANEPGKGDTANMFAETRLIDTGLVQVACVCMYACVPVASNTELTWYYGDSYQRDGYSVGKDCTSRPRRLETPLDMVLGSLSHPNVHQLMYALPESSASGSGGSDPEYREP